tara:strand:- start:4391 stop:4972 length:582 start_codon:yes stop_codon:yes gene_type:complete
MKPFLVAVVFLLGFLLPSLGNEQGAGIELKDLKGQSVRPLECVTGEAFSVVIFITTDCPIANALIPEMNRLAEQVQSRGGKLTLVQVDWELSDVDALKHATEFGIQAPVVIDRNHDLVRSTKATMTPEAFLLSKTGRILYQGRINNLFTDYGDRRKTVTKHDLRVAIEQYLAGEEVSHPKVEALGCFIPELPK